jgi:uncharacterized membrane protein
VKAAFDVWNDFENFPRFMQTIRAVERLDETRQRWTAEIEGQTVQWETQVTVTIPNRRIAWRVLGEESSSGAVTMEESGNGTEVSLHFAYGPTAPWAMMDEDQVRASAARDLQSFKDYFEREVKSKRLAS